MSKEETTQEETKKKKKDDKPLDLDGIVALLQKEGKNKHIAMKLGDDNPSEVKEWIPSGCKFLDGLGCTGQAEGIIPQGRIVEIHASEGVGKSFIAVKCIANAQKLGWDVVLFDAESSINSDFVERAGVDTSSLVYCQAKSVEFVFGSINKILEGCNKKTLFVIDSLAAMATEIQLETTDIGVQNAMMIKPRLLSEAMTKLMTPLGNKNCSLLVINQLKMRPVQNKWEDPYFVPGGTSMRFAYSLVYRLRRSEARDSRVLDESGNIIGTEVVATVEKSRFGTFKKKSSFQLVWGDDGEVRFKEDQQFEELVSQAPEYVAKGPWKQLTLNDGTEHKWQGSFAEQFNSNQKFHDKVIEIFERDFLRKKSGNVE